MKTKMPPAVPVPPARSLPMLISAIIIRTRCRVWLLPFPSTIRPGEEKRRYQRRYQREVYRKNHVTRNVALTPAEDRRLCLAAKTKGRKPTPMLRKAAFAYFDGEPVLPVNIEDAIATHTLEVRRVGTNINQLAQQANIRPETAPAQFQQAIALLQELEGVPARFFATLSVPPAHGDQINDPA